MTDLRADAPGWRTTLRQPGVAAALGAALLFGAGTPLAKLLLHSVNPWLLAGLLYLGSGLGLWLYRRLTGAPKVHLTRAEMPWLAAAIGCGGVAAPVLLMLGLTRMPASGASLLLNAEGVFTALLAWFAFGENVDRRVAWGMVLIVAGALILGWPGEARFAGVWPALAVLGACLCWALDNNLTRKVALADASWIASVKGLAAAPVNLALAFALGATLPPWPHVAGAMAVGLLAYGVSLTLFVVGLRHLGTARTGAYFSVAPFLGALLAIALGEPATVPLALAGACMAAGVWLHLTERHVHEHAHEALEHTHEHVHDEHHRHAHDGKVQPGLRHSHAHRHTALTHTHPHFPDAHHRHRHGQVRRHAVTTWRLTHAEAPTTPAADPDLATTRLAPGHAFLTGRGRQLLDQHRPAHARIPAAGGGAAFVAAAGHHGAARIAWRTPVTALHREFAAAAAVDPHRAAALAPGAARHAGRFGQLAHQHGLAATGHAAFTVAAAVALAHEGSAGPITRL